MHIKLNCKLFTIQLITNRISGSLALVAQLYNYRTPYPAQTAITASTINEVMNVYQEKYNDILGCMV